MKEQFEGYMNHTTRFKTNETAQVEIFGQSGAYRVFVRNLSKTGAFLEFLNASFIPNEGDILNITVRLPAVKKIHRITAEVVWKKGLGLGVCFINKDEVLERIMAKSNSF
jgi:hypothetical protein